MSFIGGTYASIYVTGGGVIQNIPAGTGYVKITGFTTNGLERTCTPDAASNKIIITVPGVYRIAGTISMTADTSNVTWEGAAFSSGELRPDIYFEVRQFLGSDVRDVAIMGTASITGIPRDIDVRFRHNNGSDVGLTMRYANFNVYRVGL